MDEMRKQLDALMGTDRNGDVIGKKSFTDPDVCKYYMAGLCPRDLFINTKMDVGECENLHSSTLRGEYEEARKKKDYGYEYELEMHLQQTIDDCERRIIRAQKRLEETQSPDANDDTSNQIKELYAEAEKAGEEGKVGESLEFIKKAEELKQRKAQEQSMQAAALLASIPNIPEGGPTPTQHQKLRVCDICAAYLSIFDSDRRLADHFGGKLHIGYLQIREKLKELKESRRGSTGFDEKEKVRDAEKERSRNRDRSRYDRERDYDRRDRDRDRERKYNNRDRDYNRDRDRDRDYHNRNRSNNNNNNNNSNNNRDNRDRDNRDNNRDRNNNNRDNRDNDKD